MVSYLHDFITLSKFTNVKDANRDTKHGIVITLLLFDKMVSGNDLENKRFTFTF